MQQIPGSNIEELSGNGDETNGEHVRTGRGGREIQEGLTNEAELKNNGRKAHGAAGLSALRQDLCSDLPPGDVLISDSVVCKNRSVSCKSKGERNISRGSSISAKSSLNVPEGPSQRTRSKHNIRKLMQARPLK